VLQNPGSAKNKHQPSPCARETTTGFIPLNIIGLDSLTTPIYPVSSFNSLIAASSAVSPASTKPAGTSIVTLATGGLNCFCRRISGPVAYFSHPTSSNAIEYAPYLQAFLGLQQFPRHQYQSLLVVWHARHAPRFVPYQEGLDRLFYGGDVRFLLWSVIGGGYSYKTSLVHFAFSPFYKGVYD
jgi:hypothetical protein